MVELNRYEYDCKKCGNRIQTNILPSNGVCPTCRGGKKFLDVGEKIEGQRIVRLYTLGGRYERDRIGAEYERDRIGAELDNGEIVKIKLAELLKIMDGALFKVTSKRRIYKYLEVIK